MLPCRDRIGRSNNDYAVRTDPRLRKGERGPRKQRSKSECGFMGAAGTRVSENWAAVKTGFGRTLYFESKRIHLAADAALSLC